ncbi:MAG TPA: hypothetical protein VNG69_06345, partial [Casimicrobiaceae bacterium]|nr:hypothetical protein [Casimicrobiaceae bacterium]
MTRADTIRLMHAVLDGEATLDQKRELDGLLAGDARARAEYDELGRLFEALGTVPEAYPPEGMVAAVLTAVERRDQLSVHHGVIEDKGIESGEQTPARSVRRPPEPGQAPNSRGETMSEFKNIPAKRKILIGGGIVAAIVLLAVSSRVIDFPKGNDSTVGTITPAERHRGPQGPATDIKLGGPGTQPGTQSAAGLPATGAGANNAGLNNAGLNNQGLNNQGLNNQGLNNQGLNNAGLNSQGMNSQGMNSQGMNSQGLNNQGLNNQGLNN